MTKKRAFLGVDVGTGSVRAAIFDRSGARLGLGVQPIQTFRPEPDFVEQSSEDIWASVGLAVRSALAQSALAASEIVGIGFDATCSLVVLDADDKPVSVSPTGSDAQNVIVWMDHRALEQTARINAGSHDVLRYVGGVISPEMQTPKLLWLKERMPNTFARAARFLDLPDFLTYRATGNDVRSLCSTVCKWTYLGQQQRWDGAFFEQIGLEEFPRENFSRIGNRVRPLGERVGTLSERAARELGLSAGSAVSVSIIDAHAGGLGLLGVPLDGPLDFDRRLALIGGTSSCHMAVSKEPRFIGGIWGPYYSAMVPGTFLTEGGQSATGALIDHVIDAHAHGEALRNEARARGTTAYALLNERLDQLAGELPFAATLTSKLHVLPDFHGNRSPRADPNARGMISGLSLEHGLDALAVMYLATIQAIAHGTRHIIAAMNEGGYRIDTLIACGGDTKNPVFVREHADVTGCRVVMPREPEAVLLGAAMLGAVAASDFASLEQAMDAMNGVAHIVTPGVGEVAAYHERKHRVFLQMHEDQLGYRALMSGI